MLAKQIKILRIKAGMSQSQLAEKLSVSPSAVGMYEQGRRVPSVDLLILLARLFNVSLDYLIIGAEVHSSITSERIAETKNNCQYSAYCPLCNLMFGFDNDTGNSILIDKRKVGL